MQTPQFNYRNRAASGVTLRDNLKNWVVLIVDDEFDNLIVASIALKHQGALVHTIDNAEEGLALITTTHPTFILLDLSMPKMDGWEMHRLIRQNPDTASIPVIALTAHAMDGDEARVLAAGFDGYISKPFDIMELAPCIQCILDSIPSRRPLA